MNTDSYLSNSRQLTGVDLSQARHFRSGRTGWGDLDRLAGESGGKKGGRRAWEAAGVQLAGRGVLRCGRSGRGRRCRSGAVSPRLKRAVAL